MGDLRKVATTAELPPGSAKAVHVEGRTVAIFNVEGTYYAIDDACPHADGPLSEGFVQGTDVECPLHGSVFSLVDGRCACPPADEDVRTYRVELEGDDVKIELP